MKELYYTGLNSGKQMQDRYKEAPPQSSKRLWRRYLLFILNYQKK